jgi:hypothetical protein
MLFTKEIGIEEIINQIMFGFITKIDIVFYLQGNPDNFHCSQLSAFPCLATICRTLVHMWDTGMLAE